MLLRRAGIGLLCLVPVALGGYARLTASEQQSGTSQSAGEGALVRVEMSSKVAVLLDEIPAGRLRDAAAHEALAASTADWTERATRQVKLFNYRLVFRGGFYGGTKGSLPLPPESVWKIEFDGRPKRTTIGGHDVVAVPYHFRTVIVSDADSPGVVEPALATPGGRWAEPAILPADPELLVQRTGFACMDEFEFPPNSVTVQNVSYFYDQTCDVETPATSACHATEFPALSCQDALSSRVGLIATDMNFTRMDYDSDIARRFRVGTTTNRTGADLAVVTDYLQNERSIVYRYFDTSSCDVEEKNAGSGWRRLLTFSATVVNNGRLPIHIGDPTDPANPYVQSNVFEFSPCHQHYHFSHYGSFSYGQAPGHKRAFCLEDTNRMHNDETTSLGGIHTSCENQGINAGWGDEYNYGLPGQWVDITGVDTSKRQSLSFQTNPDKFLCEGVPLDATNRPITDPIAGLAFTAFDPTSFIGESGKPVSRVRCRFPSNWSTNNIGSVPVPPSTGSFVNEPCGHGEIGPYRDCGFAVHPEPLHACTPGQSMTLTCSTQTPAILRICEASDTLGPLACANRDSVNALVGRNATAVSFVCPAVRDGAPGAGGYSVYEAPLLPSQGAASINCTGW